MTMKTVYEASTGIEAYMIFNLLQNEGIDGQVQGEHLPGGVGELQAMNLVRVEVAESDYENAKSIIAAWEAKQPEPEPEEERERRDSATGPAFVAGLAAGALAMYWLCRLLN